MNLDVRSRHPEIVFVNVDGDVVMMALERESYFGLGGVGSRIGACSMSQ